MDKNTNLPIKVKRSLPIEQKRNNKRTIQGIKRIGKIALNLGVIFAGTGVMVIGGPVVGTAGAAMSMYGIFNAGLHTYFNKQKDSMFQTNRNLKGELTLTQDLLNIKAFSKLKGLKSAQKAAIMGLEMFVGMQNFQQKYEDQNKKKDPSKDFENNVYRQVFRTETHGVNIKTMEALEELGYIQIEQNRPTKKSTLLLEKMGFKQYKEVKEILKSVATFDREKINEHQKQIYEIKFKLTDKRFDLDEIYKEFLEQKNNKGTTTISPSIKRIGILLDVLKNTNIDIETDELGMKKINHKSDKSFPERIKAEMQSKNSSRNFKESLQVEQETEQPTNEQVANKEISKEDKQNEEIDEER